jgi:hypothetical protein
MADQEDWAGPRPLRLATILSFAPAFPLCVAHGVVSHHAVPAVGLVPLAASAGVGIALLSRQSDRKLHPAAVLAADSVLAAALMVVLVFTWIEAPRSRDAGLSMLASYATMPLIVSLYVDIPQAVDQGEVSADRTPLEQSDSPLPRCQSRLHRPRARQPDPVARLAGLASRLPELPTPAATSPAILPVATPIR